ncbi:hypothetical protein NFJ02_18g30320 [Pycnococcus provasolii]
MVGVALRLRRTHWRLNVVVALCASALWTVSASAQIEGEGGGGETSEEYRQFMAVFQDASRFASRGQTEEAVAGFATAVALFEKSRKDSGKEVERSGFAAHVYNSYARTLADANKWELAGKMYNNAVREAEASLKRHRKREGSLMSFGDGEALDRYDLEELEKAMETKAKEAAAAVAADDTPKKKKKKKKNKKGASPYEIPPESGLTHEDMKERFELEQVHSAHMGIAAMKEAREDLEGAVASYERARKFSRDRDSLARTCKALGVLHMRRNDMNGAMDMLTESTDLVPNIPKGKSNLALVQHKQGMYLEAKATFQDAVELEPRNANVIANYGTLLAQMGNWKDAREAFHRALTVDPSHKHASTQLAQIEELESSGEEPVNVFAHVPEPKFRSKMARVGRVAGIPGYRT